MKTKFVLPILGLSLSIFTLGCNDNKTTEKEVHSDVHGAHQHKAEEVVPTVSEKSQSVSAPVNVVPEFTFYKLKSGIAYRKSDIPSARNTVFVLFDPSCSHCQQEAAALAKNYDKIKDLTILYISMNDPGLMANFFKTFGKDLEGKANIEMLYDRNQEFIQKFHVPKMFPANYVYGPDGSLKSSWEGEKDINEVIAEFRK